MSLLSRAVLLVACVGCSMSVVPTYDKKQVVMLPELAGIWRDSADENDYIVRARDSSYSIRLAEGQSSEASDFTGVLARDDSGSLLLDLTPDDDNIIDAIDGRRELYGGHFGRMHSVFHVNILSPDSIRIGIADPESLTTYMRRRHGNLAATRMLVVPEPRELQESLRSYRKAGGVVNTTVLRRLPPMSNCLSDFTEDLKVHGYSVRNGDGVRRHGLGLKVVEGSTVLASVGGNLPWESTYGGRAHLAFYDSVSSKEIARISREQPFSTYVDAKNHYRLELRWITVNADSVTVSVSSCPDFIPSTAEAARAEPPRFDHESLRLIPENERVGRTFQKLTWSRVPGATHYEVMQCEWGSNTDCYDRYTVSDTTYAHDRGMVLYNVRIRAFTPGIGFGRHSTPRPVPRRRR